jgi:hypothetical protein
LVTVFFLHYGDHCKRGFKNNVRTDACRHSQVDVEPNRAHELCTLLIPAGSSSSIVVFHRLKNAWLIFRCNSKMLPDRSSANVSDSWDVRIQQFIYI